jgi:hypothetical protein
MECSAEPLDVAVAYQDVSKERVEAGEFEAGE